MARRVTANERRAREAIRLEQQSARQSRSTGGTTLTFAIADDGAPLQGVIFKPTSAPPWPTAVVWHEGGFRSGSMTNGPTVTCCKDLAAAGILAMSANYRLTVQKIAGQNSTGQWPQQTNDAKAAVKYLRARSDCNGIVDAVGGSAGATHAISVATETSGGNWTSADRARRAVCLSGCYDFADRTPDPALAKIVQVINLYCGTTDLTAQRNMSPVTLMDATANSLFLRTSQKETMPYGQWLAILARLTALGLSADTSVLPGTLHAFAYWSSVKNEVIAFLKAS